MQCTFTHAGQKWTLTDEHSASSHGIPVLLDAVGNCYGRDDRVPGRHYAVQLVEHYRPQMIGPDELVQKFIYDLDAR